MISIQYTSAIADPAGPPIIESDLLERAAQAALDMAGASTEAELSIVISDDAYLRALNQQYLGIDAPTDVLSFPANELDPDSGGMYLGDIILSYPRAQLQAAAGGHSLQDELRLLVVHGVLHLLGYDHADETERANMWGIQAEILRRLGSSISAPGVQTS
jgi:probable rRNA maturation factor